MSDNQTKKPALSVFTKVVDGRETRIGSRIGVGFYHKDGVGINIILDAQPIPIDGRLELIVLPPKEDN